MIKNLSQLGEMRVWSVIITIFGDVVVPRGGRVSASALAAISEPLGIKPEALRVALHRLVKDGWIIREKSGRNSFYVLSDRGRAEFLPATKRIYAAQPQKSGPWQIAILPPNPDRGLIVELRQAGFARLTESVFLRESQSVSVPEKVVLVVCDQFENFPIWAKSVLAPDDLLQDYSKFENAISCELAGFDPAHATAIRVLLIHQWRRLLLRHPDVPVELLPDTWRGVACRERVLSLHQKLSSSADPWLDGLFS